MDFSNNVKFQLPDNIRNDSTLSTSSSKMSRHNKKKNISSASTVLRAKGGQYLQGFLLKKKRRKSGGKNYVKRFFVLNFKYGVLDYYFDDNSNHIRGNMYIKNVIISANPNEMMIFLDSGIEQWILKAFSKKDFDYWVQAFNFIKKQSFNNIQQDSLQHRSTIDGLLDDTNQQIDSLQTIYDPVTHTTTNIDDDLDDDLSVDSRSGRSISKVSTTSRIRFKEIEDKIIALKELSNKVYYHSHEDPSSNMINNNSSTNNNSTNNSSTGLNVPPLQRNTSRRSSFFWKKRKDSNISDLNNNIGNNSNNNNNNNNNINEHYLKKCVIRLKI
ncbi:unnamed protein product [[Candida] boidinii]|nr:unnamed protein product [[Candida] boidinii]